MQYISGGIGHDENTRKHTILLRRLSKSGGDNKLNAFKQAFKGPFEGSILEHMLRGRGVGVCLLSAAHVCMHVMAGVPES